MANLGNFKQYFQEMAQSEGDPAKVRLELDDEDIDFINQAVAQGVTSGAAITARYQVLPTMGLDSDAPVRIKITAPGGAKTVFIKRPHFFHLMKKLDRAGLKNAITKGLQNFSRVDAKNLLDGRLDRNTGAVNHFLTINHMKGFDPATEFDKEWGKKNANPATDSQQGYNDVIKSLEPLVGNQVQKQVWKIFQHGLANKDYLNRITQSSYKVLAQAKDQNPEVDDALRDLPTFKAILRQVMAKILIHGQRKANDGVNLRIGVAPWINAAARDETRYILRDWYNKTRVKAIKPMFDDPKQLQQLQKPQISPNSLQVSPASNLSIAPQRLQTPMPSASSFPNINNIQMGQSNISTPQQNRQVPVDRLNFKANKRKVGVRENTNEVAGATGVVSPVKPGKDYQIEGDPKGSAKAMKTFKQYIKDKK